MSITDDIPKGIPKDRDVSSVLVHKTAVAKLNRAARIRLTARLFRMGWRYADIARILHVVPNTISHDVKKLKATYLKRAVQDIKLWMADALATLDDVEAEAWEQWEKSKERKRTRSSVKQDARGLTVTETVETLEPDDAYLRIVLDCVRRREELLGLDKQTAQEVRATLILRGELGPLDHYVHVSEPELDAIRGALMAQTQSGLLSFEKGAIVEPKQIG